MDEQLIMSRTGHRSVDGVRVYKRICEEQKQEMSDVLNNATNGCTESKKIKLVKEKECTSAILSVNDAHSESNSLASNVGNPTAVSLPVNPTTTAFEASSQCYTVASTVASSSYFINYCTNFIATSWDVQ